MFGNLKRQVAYKLLLWGEIVAVGGLIWFVFEVRYLASVSMPLIYYAAIVLVAAIIDKLRKGC